MAGQHVVAVSAGSRHGLAITTDGSVWSWGFGLHGRLGHGNEQSQMLPKKVEPFAGQRGHCVGWKPQPRPHRRKRCLCLGPGWHWPARPR